MAEDASCSRSDGPATCLCILTALPRQGFKLSNDHQTSRVGHQPVGTEASGGTLVPHPVLQVQASEVGSAQLISTPGQSSREQNACLHLYKSMVTIIMLLMWFRK